MRQENRDNIDQRFKQLQLLDVDASDVSPEETGKSIHSRNGEDHLIPTSVHQYISAANPPIIVHCSAGIGRTGMLILMDTALSFMNVNEPVYPLDIVKNMRDQRPCMVQNVVSNHFAVRCARHSKKYSIKFWFSSLLIFSFNINLFVNVFLLPTHKPPKPIYPNKCLRFPKKSEQMP